MSDSEQLVLADDWDEHVLVQEERRRGIFSGKNLQSADPDKFNLIISLIAEDRMSDAAIARATKCSRNLISGIRIYQPQEIEQVRNRLAKKAAVVAEMTLDRQIEALSDPDTKIPLSQLAVAGGINIDKLQVLSGGATSRLEVVHGQAPGHDDYLAEIGLWAGSADQKARAIDGQVEVGPARIPASAASAAASDAAPAGDQEGGQDETKTD